MIEKYNRPYIVREGGSPYSHYVAYDTMIRKTQYLIFKYGKKLPFYDPKYPHITFTNQDPKDYDLLFTTKMLPSMSTQKYDRLPNDRGLELVNQKILDVLYRLCPNDFQAFPATIINDNDKMEPFENHDYYVLNICSRIDGIDQTRSAIQYKDSDLIRIYKLILKSDCLGEHHLVRLDGYESLILASHQLVKEFKKAKIKGIKFYKDYEAYKTPTPDEVFISIYKSDINAAKRSMLTTLCSRDRLDEFKNYLSNVPSEMIRNVIEMIQNMSPMHEKECQEVFELLD